MSSHEDRASTTYSSYLVDMGAVVFNASDARCSDHGSCDGRSDLRRSEAYAADACRANKTNQSDRISTRWCIQPRLVPRMIFKGLLHRSIPLATRKISSAD